MTKWTVPEGKRISGESMIFEGTFIVAIVTRQEDAKIIARRHNETLAAMPAPEAAGAADAMIGQIEARFPDWKSYRDLIDCIDVTLHRLRGG